MIDALLTPGFARLTDYVGLYALEAMAAAFLWQRAKSMDMGAHLAHTPEPIRSLAEKVPASGGKSVAVIRLAGLLMKSQPSMGGTSTVQARRDIRAAAADTDVSAILLAVESPGGTVAGTDDLAREIKAASRVKPLWAQIEDLGASAAYWAASQASAIYANSTTALIGSIGTYQVIYDTSAAAENEGVRTLLFSTGPLKGMGTPGVKVTEEQASHVQSLVNDVQRTFDAAVQKGRGLSAKELAAVRDGGVLTAQAALDARLIDGIQPLGKTLAQLTEAARGGTPALAAKGTAEPVTGTAARLPMLRRDLPMLQRR